jgi:hypothetical protein
MAKRTENSTRVEAGSTGDSMEKRMLAFAEQIGRIAGTVQAKAEGWMDRDTLNAQISSIRDSATDLLQQIGGGKKTAASSATASEKRSANRATSSARPAKTARPKATAAGPARRGVGGTKTPPAAKMKAAAGGKTPTKMGAASTSGSAANASDGGRRRSGGAVDAPGKKHRGPMPSESAATGAPRGQGSRLAKLKAANLNRMQRRG